MLAISIATIAVNAAVLWIGIRFFRNPNIERASDKHVVAALMVSAMFFGVVYFLCYAIDAEHVSTPSSINSLWAGFDFYVSVVHLAAVAHMAKCHIGRPTQEIRR